MARTRDRKIGERRVGGERTGHERTVTRQETVALDIKIS